MSLGGGSYSQSEQEVFSQARDAGVIIIAAAGNSADSSLSYPAAYEGVVSVSAVTINADLAPYSTFGSTIDVAAPGGDFSTDLNGDGYVDGVLSTAGNDSTGDIQMTYTFYQGTSMAAPHVAGVVALMKSVRPGMTPDEFDGFLGSGAIVKDIGSPGHDDLYGYGFIDAGKAVAAAMDGTITTVLSITPNNLNMGSANQSAFLTLSMIGEGPLQVTDIIETADWLSISPEQVDENGLGTYKATINREGLDNGIYSTILEFVSTQNTALVLVEMRVSDSIMVPDAGQQYVLLVNFDTSEVVDVISTRGENGVYEYQFTNVPAGSYQIFSGTDSNNDGYIGDAGEAIGAYISMDQPTIINVTGNKTDLNFVTEFSVDILESENMGQEPDNYCKTINSISSLQLPGPSLFQPLTRHLKQPAAKYLPSLHLLPYSFHDLTNHSYSSSGNCESKTTEQWFPRQISAASYQRAKTWFCFLSRIYNRYHEAEFSFSQ